MVVENVSSWLRDHGVILLFVVAQAVAGLIWGSRLDTRVNVIEQRGSPEVALLDRRMAGLEREGSLFERRLTRVDDFSAQLANIDKRLAVVETRQQSVIDILKSNAEKIDQLAAFAMAYGKPTKPP